LGRYSILPPSSSEEFLLASAAELKSYSRGFKEGGYWDGSDYVTRSRVVVFLLCLCRALLLAALIIVLLRIEQWAFRRSQELLDAQQNKLSAPDS